MKVFASYARKEKQAYRDKLEEALKPLIRASQINLWIDERLAPGQDLGKGLESDAYEFTYGEERTSIVWDRSYADLAGIWPLALPWSGMDWGGVPSDIQ